MAKTRDRNGLTEHDPYVDPATSVTGRDAEAAFDGDAALVEYFSERPVDLMFNTRLLENWLHFLTLLGEDNRRRLADKTGKTPLDLDGSDYYACSSLGHRMFADWLEETNETAFVVHDDPQAAPAWMLMSPSSPSLVPGSPVLHFTDHAENIRAQGFTLGIPDPQMIALTREHCIYSNQPRRISYGEPGYNFGYEANGSVNLDLRTGGYGSGAILFPCTGMSVFHQGDCEPQVVFWGPQARHDLGITLLHDGDRWHASNGMSGKSLNRLVRRLCPLIVVNDPASSQDVLSGIDGEQMGMH